jgi:hypothetical protein
MEGAVNRYHHLQAWALVAMGLWLLFSPFVVPGYQPGSLAVKNSDVFGIIAFVIGCGGFLHARRIDETIDMALGIGPGRVPDTHRER